MSLRVGFAGTPEFAANALRHIAENGFVPTLALTQPDRPAGRGNKLQMSAVKQSALALKIPVYQPTSLRLDGKYPTEAQAARELLIAAKLDLLIVAAYGLLLPQWVLDTPRYGCINIHGSLLPRWRGAAPIQRAIEAGDAQTGVTLMQMDIGLDTGAIIEAAQISIGESDTSESLYASLADIGAALTLTELEHLAQGRLRTRTPQPEEGANYAKKIDKAEAALDLNGSAQSLARKIRAFNPAPGCHVELEGKPLKIWNAFAENTAHGIVAGTVLSRSKEALRIACGEGVLCVTELQSPGGKRQLTSTLF